MPKTLCETKETRVGSVLRLELITPSVAAEGGEKEKRDGKKWRRATLKREKAQRRKTWGGGG